MRFDGRMQDQLRPVSIQMDVLKHAQASCLISFGDTRVLCAATCSEGVPPHCEEKEQGWVTAEYAMLPASTGSRKQRERSKRDGRSVEIERLIGRSLRGVVDLKALKGYTVRVDCDVIDADGGTRTASITGAWCVLRKLFNRMMLAGQLEKDPMLAQVAAVSVGVTEEPILDLCYREDSRAEVDMNVVMTSEGAFVEVQGTGEGRAFTPDELQAMLGLAQKGLEELFAMQKQATERRLVIASNNKKKTEEIKRILGKFYDAIVTPKELGISLEVDETGTTFEENAMLKAKAFMEYTGLDAIADDSGLCVDALGGAPGVYSARYSESGDDADNNALLLKNLADVPQEKRQAQFVSSIVLARTDGTCVTARGESAGIILFEERGEGGFGYDPLFFDEGFGCSYAELTAEQKDSISHRGRALAALAEALQCK